MNMDNFFKVEAALTSLEDRGFIFQPNNACCTNCGWTEMLKAHEASPDRRAGVYWHEQTQEAMEAGQGLYLYYGSLADNDHAGVGWEIAEALSAQGLTVEWNGDAGQAIYLPDVYHLPTHDDSLDEYLEEYLDEDEDLED